MVRWVTGSNPHGGPIEFYFSFQPVLHIWYNKAMVCAILSGMVHIKESLLKLKTVAHVVVAAGFSPLPYI